MVMVAESVRTPQPASRTVSETGSLLIRQCSNQNGRIDGRAAPHPATGDATFRSKILVVFGSRVSYGDPRVGRCSTSSPTPTKSRRFIKKGNLMQWMIRATLVLAAASWLGSEAEACHRCHSTTQCRPVCHRCRRCCCCCTTGTATAAVAAAGRPAAAATAATGLPVSADGWATVTPPSFITGGGGVVPVVNGGNQIPPVSSLDPSSKAIWDNLKEIVANDKKLRAKLSDSVKNELKLH